MEPVAGKTVADIQRLQSVEGGTTQQIAPPMRSPPAAPLELDAEVKVPEGHAFGFAERDEAATPVAASQDLIDHTKIFATRDAPFTKHLEKWSVWKESRALKAYFWSCADTVAQSNSVVLGNEEVAQIIDIVFEAGRPQCHPRGIVCLADLTNQGLSKAGTTRRVNEFFHDAANRSSNVHTRIFIMTNHTHGSGTGHLKVAIALSKLFYAHLLGTVLGLYPLHIASLVGGIPLDTLDLIDKIEGPYQPLAHNQASFGTRHDSDPGCIVHWIEGDTQLGQRQDTVIISICHTWPTSADGGKWPSSAYGISRPPRYKSKQRDRTPPNTDLVGYEIPSPATRLLIPAIFQAVEADLNSHPSMKSCHWLAAVMQVEYSFLCYEFDKAEKLHTELESYLKTRLRGRHETRLRQTNSYQKLSEAIQACVDETEAVCADNHLRKDGQQHPSLDRIIAQVKRLQRLVNRRLTTVESAAEQELKLRQVQMTQLSIDESRSAIALTFLAFIFVPMSLATSVFGMNVQEINGTGSSAWIPVLLAIGLMILSLAGLRTWRVWEKWLKEFEQTNDIKDEEKWRAVRQEVKAIATQRRENIADTIRDVPSGCRAVLGAIGHQTRKITSRTVRNTHAGVAEP